MSRLLVAIGMCVSNNKSFAFIVSGRFVAVISQLICVGIYSAQASQENLGVFYFWVTLSYSINAMILVPLDYFNQKSIMQAIDKSHEIRSLAKFNFKILMVIALIVSIGSCYEFMTISSNWDKILLALFLSIFIYISQTSRNILNNLGYGVYVSTSVALEAVCKVIMLWGFIKLGSNVVNDILFSWVGSVCLSAFFTLHKCIKIAHSTQELTTHKHKLTDVFRFCAPFSIGSVCNWLQNQGYRLVLVPLGYQAEVGTFSLVASLGSAGVGVITLIFNQHYQPQLYRSGGDFLPALLKKTCVFLLMAVVGYVFFGSFLVGMLTHEIYNSFWIIGVYGVIIDGLYMPLGLLSIYASLTDKSQAAIASGFFGLVIQANLLLILILFDCMSVWSVGVPLLIAQTFVTLSFYYVLRNPQEAP